MNRHINDRWASRQLGSQDSSSSRFSATTGPAVLVLLLHQNLYIRYIHKHLFEVLAFSGRIVVSCIGAPVDDPGAEDNAVWSAKPPLGIGLISASLLGCRYGLYVGAWLPDG